MAKALAWVRHHPGILVLIAALIAGQVLQSALRSRVEESVPRGQLPVVAASVLAVAVGLAILVIVLRVRLGGQLLGGVRSNALSLPAPESLPPRYAVDDPPRQVVGGTLALIDIGLLLLIQNTIRAPLLSIGDDYVTRPQANLAYVAAIVLVALVLLIKLYRTGGPVLVLLLWWALDRVVPTAGFLGARPPAPTVPAASLAPLPAARDTSLEPTVVEAEFELGEHEVEVLVAPLTTLRSIGDLEPTVVAPDSRHDATIVAPLTTLTTGLEPTLLAASAQPDEDATVVAPQAKTEPNPPPTEVLDGPTIVTGRRPEPDSR